MISKTAIIIITINLSLIAIQLGLTTIRATEGDHLHRLTNQLQTLSTQNHHLKSSIYAQSSILYLQTHAQDSQLIPAKITSFKPKSVAAAQP